MTLSVSTVRALAIRVGRWLFADLRRVLAITLLTATGWMILDEAFRAWNPNRWRPAIAVESPVFIQLCGAHGSWHALAIWEHWQHPWRLHWERRNYIGNGGYQDAKGINILGFALVIQPRHIRGTDTFMSPYAAVAVPYWFFAGLVAAWLVCRLRKRKRLLSADSPIPPASV